MVPLLLDVERRAANGSGTPARTVERPRPGAGFAAALAVLLAILYVFVQPNYTGDVEEYAVMTVALAQHGSPDLRPGDAATAKTLLPWLAPQLDELAQGLGKPGDVPRQGYYRGHDGRAYAIHFFAYPALAALAYKLVPLAGAHGFKCFLAVNLAFVFVLGLALRRLFGSNARAAFGVALFLLCGGFLYAPWSGPETMSASALLAALALYATGAPVSAGLLAGIAATHNPPIVLFAAFAPLMRLCLTWERGAGLAANARRAIGARELLGSTLTCVLFALPVAFNLWAFSTPSIIAKVSTSIEFATANRLFSLYFDLNQGMLVGVPGLFAALLLCGWRGRAAALAACALLFSVALAAPSLVPHNWNSGGAGMMRYAFWAAMPLLFAFLWRLRERARWPVALLAVLVALQVAAIVHARKYNATEFSPLARWVLAHAPRAYHPDPEIFHERATHAEGALDPRVVDSYEAGGIVVKRLFNLDNLNADTVLCGPGRALSPASAIVAADRNWRYINGPVECTAAIERLAGQPGLVLADGWSAVEHGGGDWEGVWSQAPRARLAIRLEPGQRPTRLALHGRYYEGNRRTRVRIDGVDLGWQPLDQHPEFELPVGKGAPDSIAVELEFDAPHVPPASQPDQRHIAFFLQKVTLR
jgi:hypothetical protein